MHMTEKPLNTSEASQYLGVTRDTLAVWRTTRRYELPYIKVGRLVKYRLSDLDKWLNQRTKEKSDE
ncbi:MAG: helix-turn-helix domain-containing protein [Alphaproteobacteria bacterium]|nr:helix-turn-helix domain-containing protein [Alphaproteobacteria bacterium]